MFPGQNLISQMLPASRDIRRFQQQMQQQQQMGGGSYQNSLNPDYARPAGPDALGLGPTQDRSSLRDALNSMPRGLSFGLGMVPGIGTALNIGRLANAGMSAYEASQLAPSRDARERSQDQFRAFEIADMNAPQYGPYADDSMDRLSFNAPVSSPVSQSSFSSEVLAPMAPEAISSPVARSSITGESLPSMAPVAFSSPVARSSITGESLASMAGDFGIRSGGAGGEFGGGVGTGNFGGSPADAADLGYAHGGKVKLKDLIQPGPGKDDGYGGLQDGEYVIKKDAVKKYGIKMLENINQRKVSKKQVSNFFKNHG